jgi:competence protein ComEA
VSDLDRPRLALYLALGLVVCFLGARYLRSQLVAPAGGEMASAQQATTSPAAGDGETSATAAGATPAAAGATSATAAGATPGAAAGATPTVQLERADGGWVTVHVAGAVRRPGLYRLPAGSRVNDALRRAGGAGRTADLTAVNLAAKLEDGRQILVPRRPPAAARGAPVAAAGGSAAGGGSTVAAPGAPAAPINLNTATLEQLDTLDGVGPGIAQRILNYREQHGGFRRVEELGEVPGIGDKRLATLTPLVTV